MAIDVQRTQGASGGLFLQGCAEPGGLITDADRFEQMQAQRPAEARDQASGKVGAIGEQMQHGLGTGVKLALTLGQLQQFDVLHDPSACFEQIDDRAAQRIDAGFVNVFGAVVSTKQMQPTALIEHKLRARLVGAARFKCDAAGDFTALRGQQRRKARVGAQCARIGSRVCARICAKARVRVCLRTCMRACMRFRGRRLPGRLIAGWFVRLLVRCADF